MFLGYQSVIISSMAAKRLPHSHWNSSENQRLFLEKIKKRFNIQEPTDWGKVSVRELKNAGGESILRRYQSSLLNCLKSVYGGDILQMI